jgi:hypothetical protein
MTLTAHKCLSLHTNDSHCMHTHLSFTSAVRAVWSQMSTKQLPYTMAMQLCNYGHALWPYNFATVHYCHTLWPYNCATVHYGHTLWPYNCATVHYGHTLWPYNCATVHYGHTTVQLCTIAIQLCNYGHTLWPCTMAIHLCNCALWPYNSDFAPSLPILTTRHVLPALCDFAPSLPILTTRHVLPALQNRRVHDQA